MKETNVSRPRTLAAAILAAFATIAVAHPAAAQGQGRGGGQPGGLQGGPPESASVVAFVDSATLVRFMARQQVTAGGRTEQRIVVPARHCAGLAPNGSKSVALPDIRWGLRTTTPVAARRTKATLSFPGQPKKDEVLPDGMPGSSERAFTFTRPGTRSIRVTLLSTGGGAQVGFGDGSVRTIGSPAQPLPTRGTGVTDGSSNTVIVGETGRPSLTVCVSDVFVADPPVEVLVNIAGPPGQNPAERRSTF